MAPRNRHHADLCNFITYLSAVVKEAEYHPQRERLRGTANAYVFRNGRTPLLDIRGR